MREASCSSMMPAIVIYALLFIHFLSFIMMPAIFVYHYSLLFIHDLLCSACGGSMWQASCGSVRPAIIVVITTL
jgi:hypothetical protein